MKLLIVTPTLGNSPYLEETMRSIEEVRAQGIDIIHVFATPESKVADLAARYPGSTVVADAGKAGGMFEAINCGIKGSPSDDWEWFTYINDDDDLMPGFGEVFRQHAKPENVRAITYGDAPVIDTEGKTMNLMSVERNAKYFMPLMYQHVTIFTQQGMMCSRLVIDTLKGFDRNFPLHADFEFWVRGMLAGFEYRYYPVQVGKFRIRPGQLSTDNSKRVLERNEILKKFTGKPPGTLARLWARIRFHFINFPRHLERIRTTGFTRSYDLLAQKK